MEPDYALCRMPQECASWSVAKPHGTAHAPLPVAADGIITDLTELVAISASALVVRNGLIQPLQLLSRRGNFFIAPAATDALALYQ